LISGLRDGSPNVLVTGSNWKSSGTTRNTESYQRY
jgi:hypothetical protein